MAVGRGVLDELLYYFGLDMQDKTFDAQVGHIVGYGGLAI